jgi:hypothetical protein
VEVRLEESSPKRAQILETFAERLGSRWEDTQFSAEQIMTEMFRESVAPKVARRSKTLIVMIAMMLLMILAGIAAVVIARMH